MGILLKQRYFSAFERPKLLLRVVSQKSHLRLVCRGVLGQHLVFYNFFWEMNMD